MLAAMAAYAVIGQLQYFRENFGGVEGYFDRGEWDFPRMDLIPHMDGGVEGAYVSRKIYTTRKISLKQHKGGSC